MDREDKGLKMNRRNKALKRLFDDVRHHGNALHVYSRLCRFMSWSLARKIARRYEALFHPVIYKWTIISNEQGG